MLYHFDYDWATYHFPSWQKLVSKYNPKTVLEIGSFEGRSTIFWAERVEEVECVDTWNGSEEHEDLLDFNRIEQHFDHNTANHNVIKHKGLSSDILPRLITEKKKFDLIYIDGSHTREDVLSDAIFCYHLSKKGTVIIFDDYLFYDSYRFSDWKMDKPSSITSHPKTAIDAFVNIYEDKLRTISVGRQYTVEIL